MIIDAKNLILGRLASYVAKKALLGDKIEIVNCEYAVIVGNKKDILTKFKIKMQRGVHTKGPFLPRMPDRFVKRIIRGMLPYKMSKGRTAFKNIKCYIGIPDKHKSSKLETLNEINVSKKKIIYYVNVKTICSFLGRSI